LERSNAALVHDAIWLSSSEPARTTNSGSAAGSAAKSVATHDVTFFSSSPQVRSEVNVVQRHDVAVAQQIPVTPVAIEQGVLASIVGEDPELPLLVDPEVDPELEPKGDEVFGFSGMTRSQLHDASRAIRPAVLCPSHRMIAGVG